MRKILLVQTGGTISCHEEQGELTPSEKGTDAVWECYTKEHPGEVEFTVIKPFTILSENLTPNYWEKLTNAINEAHPEQYDGVLVTHGTDSLDFTRAFLEMHYGGGIQVLGALYPPTDPRTDAFINFEKGLSLCGPISPRKFHYTYKKGLVLMAYPGLDYNLYPLDGDSRPDFVIHNMYHSGTAAKDLGAFVKKAARLGIPVYAVGFPSDSNRYEGRRDLEEAGLIYVPDLSFSQVLVKLTLGGTI